MVLSSSHNRRFRYGHRFWCAWRQHNGQLEHGHRCGSARKQLGRTQEHGQWGGGAHRNGTGSDNLAEGYSALEHNSSGSSNIAVGSQAGANLTTGNNNTDIGAPRVAGESNTIRIGARSNGSSIQTNAFIQGIHGATVANGVEVIVGTTGQLGRVQSSKRFKEAIKPMDKASEAILALKPVTFRYKHELDPNGVP